MADIKIIAAVGKNLELGYNNNLIWHIKDDLKFFKETTMGHYIVMGYNTFKSLPKVLTGRTHLVLTHRNIDEDQVITFDSFDTLLEFIKTIDDDVYVIGGAAIYKLFIDEASTLILTEIDAEAQADVYFPSFDKKEYSRCLIKKGIDNGINYAHVNYRRLT